ncbi:hypothetical protein RUM44_001192 [Polyplax serrata]|uniref:L-Fucosyltransferase n=1 Tax=Polyplax serrata TaxID=468196 RepID=A0ABR1B9S5_POLSC
MFTWIANEEEVPRSALTCSTGRDLRSLKYRPVPGRKVAATSRPGQNLLGIAIVLAITIIVVVHVAIFPLYEVVPIRNGARKLLGDYEQSLCSSNFKPLRPQFRRKCPKDGIVTVSQGGRLGNQMWEYASVWAVARRTGLEPFVPGCLLRALEEVFSDLTVSNLGYISHCRIDWQDVVPSPDQWTRLNQSIVLPRFVVLPETVLTWIGDIRQEFRFKRTLADNADKILQEVAQNRLNLTYVGVHVRRTDYIYYLWRTRHASAADIEFFSQAMNYFRSKYRNTVFIVVSDDPDWCKSNLGGPEDDVYVASIPGITGPGQDIATMSACNHSIIDYGTFGVWGAILAGGETLVYNMSRHSSIRVAELLPQWQVVS